MPLTIIIGAQWGDEGKGHITDRLAQSAAVVARYSGGGNAGPTGPNRPGVLQPQPIPSGLTPPRAPCLHGPGPGRNPAQVKDGRNRGGQLLGLGPVDGGLHEADRYGLPPRRSTKFTKIICGRSSHVLHHAT